VGTLRAGRAGWHSRRRQQRRISRNLVRGSQIAAAAGASYSPTSRLEELFMLAGNPAPGRTSAELEQALRAEVARLRETLISPDELARVVAQVVAADVYQQDSLFYQGMRLGILETVGLGWNKLDDYVQRIQAVTPEQVREVARKYLIDDRLTVATLEPLPLDGRRPAAPACGWAIMQFAEHALMPNSLLGEGKYRIPLRLCPPENLCYPASWPPRYCWLPGLAAAVPAIQNWRTANGVPVYFIPRGNCRWWTRKFCSTPVRSAMANGPGLAKLTNALLEEGAGDWSADAIADRLDRVGARLNASSRRDSASVRCAASVDPRYLQPAVETVARLLKEPSFAPDAVERVRQQMLTRLQERAQSPGAIAQDAFFKALYGNHPYGSPPDGDPASLNAITRAEVQDFHRRYYTAANAVVAIVGDLDRPAAEQLANALVGGLPKGEPMPAAPRRFRRSRRQPDHPHSPPVQPKPHPDRPNRRQPRRSRLLRALSGQPCPGRQRPGFATVSGNPREARAGLRRLQRLFADAASRPIS
jgi:predicted Zn-dependent peptidase